MWTSHVDVSVEGDVVQHMLVTADISQEEYDKEAESDTKKCMMVTTFGEISKVIQGTRSRRPKKLAARRLQGMIGNPAEKELTGMVREKLIANCPVTVQLSWKCRRHVATCRHDMTCRSNFGQMGPCR